MNYICNCKKINLSDKSYTYWEDREVTTDELEIINFLDNEKDIKFKSALHIGIGNSYFAKKFATRFNITGITISQNEVKKALSMNLINYQAYLLDKYSVQFKQFLDKNRFDLIVDTNLKSYSCCQETFKYMINNILESIRPNGMLITSVNGMKWFKDLKPKLTFSLKKLIHFKLKEINGNEFNILTKNELKSLCKTHNLILFINDKICCLKK